MTQISHSQSKLHVMQIKKKAKLENQNLHYSGSSQSFIFIILQKENKFQGIKPQCQTPGFNLLLVITIGSEMAASIQP